ncbi:MAG TPA: 3-carboxy-cis,cis-muconate cycloisomerase [Ktedonobacterales bacterium]|nr:3-carboxy-cis,cis-muconate cycloisomerase [Ktedonobacterales bacterium]
MDAHHARSLLDLLFSTESMRAVFSDHSRLQAMLAFERALARAEARSNVIPERAAKAIAERCRAESFDLDELARGAEQAGNLAIPVVRALTALVERDDAEAAQYVHWGATSQDVIDTGLTLQMRDGLDLIVADLARLAETYRRLADAHKSTLMVGRTWMQQAAPITFGLKIAGWLSAVRRDQERLRELRSRALALQLGGAVGSLAAFGEKGLEVAANVAKELELSAPDLPWHAHRDRMVEVATTLGLLIGTLGKVARDLSLMSQSEVAEASEPSAPGRGGSSTMPQKRNPVGAAVALAAAQRAPGLVATMLAAMPQEHERGLGGWQAEWDTIPEIFLLAAGALRRMVEVAEGLDVDAQRMRANLDVTQGLIFAESVSMALARRVGKQQAHHLVREATHRASAQHRHLRDALADDESITAHLSPDELDQLFDPRLAAGLSERLVERVLEERRVRPTRNRRSHSRH